MSGKAYMVFGLAVTLVPLSVWLLWGTGWGVLAGIAIVAPVFVYGAVRSVVEEEEQKKSKLWESWVNEKRWAKAEEQRIRYDLTHCKRCGRELGKWESRKVIRERFIFPHGKHEANAGYSCIPCSLEDNVE